MTTKLSLTIDEDVAKKIKAIAKQKKTSVSLLTQEYYESLIQENKKKESWVNRVAGIVKNKNISDEESEKRKEEYLKKKPSLMALAGIVKNKNVSDEDLEKIKEEYLKKKQGL